MIGKWLVAAAVGLVAGAGHAAEVVLRWGDVVPATHPSAQMIDRVAAAVKTKTGGRVEIQGFPGGQLGGSRDMIEAVANGIQEMVTEGAANFGTWLPTISVVEAPYIWRDAAHLVAAMSGPIGKDYDEQLRKARGMRILGTTYYGTRHLTTSKKEIRSVADMVGFKLRVPENEVFKAMAEAWSARPTPINFSELYLALQQGVVDGQENPLPTIQSAKLFEVQKYLVLTGHIITPRLVVINEAAYQRLKPEARAALEAAVAEGIAWQNEEIRKAEASLVQTLEKAGMTVITPDVASFREAVLKVVPQRFEARWGKGTWERIQAVR
jgi:tripartite ATP-independent transporter DctP family solute receptor